MELDQAWQLLQLGPGAPEPERRAAFERQRRLLDERIAAAATPRLADTFRLAQARLVEAYEAVELAEAAAESPALRAVTDHALPSAPPSAPTAPIAPPAPAASAPPPPATAPAVVASAPAAPPPASAAAAPLPAPVAAVPAPERPRRLAGVVLALAVVAAAGGGYAWYEHARHARLDRLRERLQHIDERLMAIAREVPEPAPIADGSVDALREQWRQQRATLRASALETARKRIDAHPAHAAAEQARIALAANREDATASALDAAEHACPTAEDCERAFLAEYAQPLLTWCFEHAKGDDRPLRWARDEEPRAVADVAAALRARLAALDRAAPPAPESADDVAHLAGLVGEDDADTKRWRAKLAEIARLRAYLVSGMPKAKDAKGAERDALGAAVVRLQALIGADEAEARAWRAALPDATDAEKRLRAALAKLAAADAVPVADDLSALSALEQVAGADDADARRLRASIPDRLYAAALREADEDKQASALVAAANQGSWKALARLVALQRWSEFASLDPQRFDPARAPGLDGGPTASQLAGEALANWACRHSEIGERWKSEMTRARSLMMADPITDPVVMHEAAWLWDEYEPKDSARATTLREQALEEARRRLSVTPVDDRIAWRALLALARDAASGLKRLPDQLDYLERLRKTVGDDAELRAAVQYGRGMCLEAAGNPKGSVGDAEAAFADAADAYRRMANPPASALSAALVARAGCAADERNPDRSFVRAIALAREAAAIAAAGKRPASQASALQEAAACEEPARNAQGSWRAAAEDYGRAAAAWAAAGSAWKQAQAQIDQGRCLMSVSPPVTSEARAILVEAQHAAERGKYGYGAGLALYRLGLSYLPDSGAADASWSRADECFADAAKRFTDAGSRADAGHLIFRRGNCARPDNNPAGSWKAATGFFVQAAAIAEEVGAADDLGEALFAQASCRSADHDPAGSYAEAAALYARAAAAYEKAGLIADQSVAMHQQAWCIEPDQDPHGSWDQAAALYDRAAALRTADGKPPPHVSITLNNEAYCLQPDTNAKGSWSRSQELYRQALERAGEEHDAEQQGIALTGLGVCAEPDKNTAGSWSEALPFIERAVASLRQADQGKIEVQKRLAAALHDLGWCSDPENNPAGSYQTAEAAYAEAARLRIAIGDAKLAAVSLHNQAACNAPGKLAGGTWQRAASLYEDAAAKAAAGQDKKQQAKNLLNQAVCLYNENTRSDDHIRQLAHRALDLAREVDDQATIKDCEDLLKE